MNNEDIVVPSVSIIVPVKNGGATIRELLESLMQIDYDREELEIVVVDGHSTDNTREIVSKFPVKLLEEERAGLNAARNTGIKHSKGEVLAFTDCDCVVPKDWIRRIIDNFKDSQVGCVGGNILGYYDNFLSRYCDESIMPVMRIFKKREVLDTVKPPLQYPAGCNMATKRGVLKKVGFFDENVKYGFDEDELVERICEGGFKMVLDPKVFVKHKHRPTLLGLLKQTFQYGRGGGSLAKLKGMGSAFSKWTLLYILGFVFWISMFLSSALLTVFAHSVMSLMILLVMLLVPPVALTAFYVYGNFKEKDKNFGRIFVYPFMDILRSMTFLAGAIYQVLKREDKIKK